jgi:hypothetical protein
MMNGYKQTAAVTMSVQRLSKKMIKFCEIHTDPLNKNPINVLT